MTRIKLNSKTTLIIHDDKSASLIQAPFYKEDADYDEVALSPALVLELKQYLNTYIPEEE